MTEHYLEDFVVGQKFGSGRLGIDAARIKSFAAEFDPQPFHLNEEAAKRSILRGLAASGWHTAAITMRLLNVSELKPGRRHCRRGLRRTEMAAAGAVWRRTPCRERNLGCAAIAIAA
jgi:acyl dehydratase